MNPTPPNFLYIPNKEDNPYKIREIGEVKKGFTYHVERSNVLKTAEMFVPLFGSLTNCVEKGSCDPEIISNDSKEQKEEKESEMKEEKEKKEECYVEMNVALGVLENKNDDNESEDEEENDVMIEELN